VGGFGGGFVCVADGPTRGHTAAVNTLVTDLTDDALILRIAPRLKGADLGLEVWGATRKADVLAKALKREVKIVAKPARA
jgi:hypothetical protein